MTSRCQPNSLRRCQNSNNLSATTTPGPATDALERSLKRRRIELNNVVSVIATSTVNNELNGGKTVTCAENYPHKIMASSSSNDVFEFNDAYDIINIVGSEDYQSFPKIEWKWDDDGGERYGLACEESAASFKSTDTTNYERHI
jgi:hypothetical protein